MADEITERLFALNINPTRKAVKKEVHRTENFHCLAEGCCYVFTQKHKLIRHMREKKHFFDCKKLAKNYKDFKEDHPDVKEYDEDDRLTSLKFQTSLALLIHLQSNRAKNQQ